jgi:ribonuclease E
VEPRETYEPLPEAYEAESEFSAMNLINHPSYQELGDANNKRRVRRRHSRLGINGGNGKEEPRLPNLGAVNDQEAEFDNEAELPVSSEPSMGKATWIERAERSKPTKPEPAKPVVEPPEIVSVEMTPQEQDVYALMGVSPLVRLNREVKNSKSVIINVTLPGELPANPPESIVEPTPVAPVRNVITVEPDSPSVPEAATDTAPAVAAIADESEATSSSVVRRRRRRSSATDADTST